MPILADAEVDAVERFTAERLTNCGFDLLVHPRAPNAQPNPPSAVSRGSLTLKAFVDKIERDAFEQAGAVEQRLTTEAALRPPATRRAAALFSCPREARSSLAKAMNAHLMGCIVFMAILY